MGGELGKSHIESSHERDKSMERKKSLSMYVCICVYVHIHVCVYACGDQRPISALILLCHLLYLLETQSLVCLRLSKHAKLPSQCSPGISLHSPWLGLQVQSTTLGLFQVCSGDPVMSLGLQGRHLCERREERACFSSWLASLHPK